MTLLGTCITGNPLLDLYMCLLNNCLASSVRRSGYPFLALPPTSRRRVKCVDHQDRSSNTMYRPTGTTTY